MKFQENLKWNDHVKNIANYPSLILWVKSSIHTLPKLKHFTDFHHCTVIRDCRVACIIKA